MPLRSTVLPALSLILLLISATPLRAQYKLPPLDADKLASWPCDIREEIQGLYSPIPVTRVRSVMHLFQMGRRAAPAVIFLMYAISYSSGMEPPAESSPLSTVSAEGSDAGSAARILERIGEPSEESLLRLLMGEDRSPKKLAAWALGEIKEKRAVDPLIALLTDEDPGFRWWAAFALGNIGDDRAAEPLIGALRDKSNPVRKVAAWALGEIGDPRAAETLAGILSGKGTSLEVKRQAAAALGMIGGERAVDVLIPALGDPDGRVRGRAAEALKRLDVRTPAQEAETLVAALGSGSGLAREEAARALRKVKDRPLLVPPLIAALGGEVSEARTVAAEILGAMGDRRAVSPLITALRDKEPEVRGVASWALGKLKDPDSVNPLIRALEDDDPFVRLRAARALGEIAGSHLGADAEKWRKWRNEKVGWN